MNPRTPIALLIALTAAACVPGEHGPQGDAASPGADEAAQPVVDPPDAAHVPVRRPKLFCPTVLGFAPVAEGQTEITTLQIRNIGDAVLVVVRLTVEGPGFGVNDGGVVRWAGADGPTEVPLSPPLLLMPGQAYPLEVLYQALDPGRASGKLRVFSNDPDPAVQHGALVKLRVNDGPTGCMTLVPETVEFGWVPLDDWEVREVEIRACGGNPLRIDRLRLLGHDHTPSAYPDSPFWLDLTQLPGVDAGVYELSDTDPAVLIPAGHSAWFRLWYAPLGIERSDRNGDPIPDAGFVEIVSNAAPIQRLVEVQVSGEHPCGGPVPFVYATEGNVVPPQAKLHLIGSASWSCAGLITDFDWTVLQPDGSQSVFLPSSSAPDPTFEVNAAGSYVFMLSVRDETGTWSSGVEHFPVNVVPDQALHIELLWHTPGDPVQWDEGVEAGADLDLHFTHPDATGLDFDGDAEPDGWFDELFDCYWFNPQPEWSSADPAEGDDPSLARADFDGAGPEILTLAEPEAGQTYRIGVHYWNDHGFGPSSATVRVYVKGQLAFESPAVDLSNHELWEVATFDWSSGEVTPIVEADGSPKVFPPLDMPLFPP